MKNIKRINSNNYFHSDTHSLTTHIKYEIPDGDIFIHAGDFTRCGKLDEVVDFNNWIGKSILNIVEINYE